MDGRSMTGDVERWCRVWKCGGGVDIDRIQKLYNAKACPFWSLVLQIIVICEGKERKGKERMERRREKEKEKERVVGLGFENHILDLPIHMLSEIMFKLPAISILRCGSVCTKFRTIITDSSFQQSYLSRAPVSCVVLSNHQRLSCIDCGSQSEILPPNQGSSCMAMQAPPPPPPKRRTPNTLIDRHNRYLQLQLQALKRKSRFVTFLTNRRMNLVNSSHGLLCLRTCTNRTRYLSLSSLPLYFVCNPLLGEILSVPPAPNAVDDDRLLFSAFGFNPKTKHYKILQLVWKSDHMVAELYRLGDKTWSVIESPSSAKPVANSNSSFDPSLNGVLHWVTDKISCSELICSFDLHMNKFKWVAPPSHFDSEYVNKMSGISVGVLKGCLCLCYVIESARFETWSMDKYDVKESWRKVFSIDIESIIGLRPQDKHRPMGFNSSGDMWLRAEDSNFHSNSQCLLSFTAQTGVFKYIDVGVSASNIQATPQVLSYVSLRDMLHLPATRLQLHKLTNDKNYGFGLFAM